ncbi:surfactant B protein [Histomonas meleagridis]|uniref:surfactant B protein n=1 Tax=Histomonas meleagridis TaxID=135588 RepID=UPI00355ACB2F|nr:surfactant B protein [Histomonas meleagridis]KAH0802457.1 surfactant B protein [Histomonas meleagridis]
MFALLFVSALCDSEIELMEISEGLENIDSCAICKNVITGIVYVLETSHIQSDIKQLVSELTCDKFSVEIARSICNGIVNNLLPDIISLITKGIQKADICNKIKFCNSNNELYEEDEIEYVEIPEGLENGIACSICKHLVSAVSKILINTQVQTKVTEQAQKLCAKFPKIGRDYCNKLVSTSLSKLMDWLNEKLTSSEICNKLKSCKSNDEANDDAYLELYLEMDEDDYVTEIELPFGLSNSDSCAICKEAVDFVSHAMGNSIIQAIVKTIASAACELILDETGSKLCKTIIELSVGPIMSWLGNKSSQSEICTKLGHC